MLKSKLFKIFSAILILIILLCTIFIIYFKKNQSPDVEIVPPPSQPVISNDKDTSTARIYFDSASDTASSPAYRINSSVAPHRLEITLYNVLNVDTNSISQALSSLPSAKDWYRTILLDDSTATFTVEFPDEVSFTASEYNPDGYIDLTVTENKATASPVHIIRSKSSPMNESLALLCESASDFSPSIVKTRSGEFCVTIGTFSSYNEATDILNSLKNNSFYIEEINSDENPK